MFLVALATLTLQPADGARVPYALPPDRDLRSPARSNLAAYFSDDDYPVGARFNREQGTVGIVIFVNAAGGVEGCSIAASSNSSALDEASCRIIRRRARFTPAIHSSGRSVADFVAARIRWQIVSAPPSAPAQAEAQNTDPDDVVVRSGPARPEVFPLFIRARPLAPLSSLVTYRDYPAGAPRGADLRPTTFRLTIGPDGNVDACVISVASGSPELDDIACRLMRERARFSPARIQAGNAISDDHWGWIDWGNRERPPVSPPPIARRQ